MFRGLRNMLRHSHFDPKWFLIAYCDSTIIIYELNNICNIAEATQASFELWKDENRLGDTFNFVSCVRVHSFVGHK